ncbi:MAG: hypothetical protein AAFU85_25050 [Planctomycetota bacterium]
MSVVSVNLYANADGTCRFEVRKKQREKRVGEPIAVGKPITEAEVRELVQKARQDRLRDGKQNGGAGRLTEVS